MVFLNNNDQVVSQEKAAKFIYLEYENGEVITRRYGSIGK